MTQTPHPAFRIEKDSMGDIQVPQDAAYGAQTQRALNNFQISTLIMPSGFIQALLLIKASAAQTNHLLGELDPERAEAIEKAALVLLAHPNPADFPLDIFQTGSGTSTNMNANEVIAHYAKHYTPLSVHPNDHVNMSQSSNDTIPTAIHVSAALALHSQLLPALTQLHQTIQTKAQSLSSIVKTGRTHLMDAMPIRFDQELSGWAKQIELNIERLSGMLPQLCRLAQGGTAIGTGINAHPQFATAFAQHLSHKTQLPFQTSDCLFESLSTQDTVVALSGQLKVLAVSLMKIANDLRWMNSGPLSGLSEIALPSLQPGSSIMPGKVNPVIPEAVCMVAAQVIGNDATITIAGQSGNFQLNVMLPVIAYNILQSIDILSTSTVRLAESAIAGFTVNQAKIESELNQNPILVTALNPVIGYEKGAEIAKAAYKLKKPIKEIAAQMSGLDPAELDRLLDPKMLTEGGIHR
jgi:fumarate hydratase class II